MINLLLFFIPVLVLLEIRTRNIDGQYAQKSKGLLNSADSIQLLIVGNSHANDGISPQEFEVFAYNVAFGSQSIYFDKRITLKYLDQLTSLRFVLVSVDFSSLYRLHRSGRDQFYHYYYDIDFQDQSFLLEDISYFFFGFTPKNALQNIFKSPSVLNRGWQGHPIERSERLSKEAIKARASHFNDEVAANAELRSQILSDLEDFLEKLIVAGVQPVIITNPIHKDLYKLLDEDVLRQNHLDCQYLSTKYQVPYRSYHLEPFDDSEYFNADHLNEVGAKRYSMMLNQFINELDSIAANPLPL